MTMLVTHGTVFVEESVRAQAAELVQRASGIHSPEFRIASDDGTAVEVSGDLGSFLLYVLRGISRGRLAVTTLPDELTTTMAAELVGVSRPTLMKLVRSGELPSRPVGSHTRLRTSDVLALRKARAGARREALEALQALDQELGAD